MRWIYRSDGSVDPDEAALAGRGVSAILGSLDLSSASAADSAAALLLLSRCVGELAEAAGSPGPEHAADRMTSQTRGESAGQ